MHVTAEQRADASGRPELVRVGNLRVSATALLAIAMACSAALLLALTADNTFFNGDEWSMLLHRRGHSLDVLLAPNNEHIALVPVLVYKLFEQLFGIASAVPYRLVAIGTQLLCAGLVFAYARRRLGDWLALAPAVLLLFLGSAWEDVFWSFQMGFFGSIATGVGALLALERRDRRGDLLACALLLGSVSCSDLGLAFALGAALDVALGREALRRAWIALVPLLLWGLWYLKYGRTTGNDVSVANVLAAPAFVADSLAAALGSALGFGSLTLVAGVPVNVYEWGRPLALAALILLVARLVGGGVRSPRLWVVLALPLVFWGLTALDAGPARDPTASRYAYPSVVFLVLIGAELFAGVRLTRRAGVAAACVAAVALWANLGPLKQGAAFFRTQTHYARAATAALEIGRGHIPPAFAPPDVSGTPFLKVVNAASYLSATAAFGSPADTPAELLREPGYARDAADVVLFRGEQLGLGRGVVDAGGAPPSVLGQVRERRPAGPACVRVAPAPGVPFELRLAVPGVGLRLAGGADATLNLRRFGDGFVVGLGGLPARAPMLLRLPRDGSPVPWTLRVTGASAPLTACGLAAR